MEKTFKERLESIICELNEIEKERGTLIEQLRQADLKQEDLLHIIEFTNLNASEGYKVYKMMQEIRKERRAIKDKIEASKYLKPIGQMVNRNSINQAIKGIEKTEEHHERRKYRLRVMEELVEYNNRTNSEIYI